MGTKIRINRRVSPGACYSSYLLLAFLAISVCSPLNFAHEAKIGGPFEAKKGALCVVCNQRVSASDHSYLIDGFRFQVHRGHCEQALLRNPETFTRPYVPNNLLFNPNPQGFFSPLLMIPAVWLFTGLISGAFNVRAVHKATGHAAPRWFWVGLAIPVLSTIVCCLKFSRQKTPNQAPPDRQKTALTHDPRPCPYCGALQHPAAKRCLACGGALEPVITSELDKIKRRPYAKRD